MICVVTLEFFALEQDNDMSWIKVTNRNIIFQTGDILETNSTVIPFSTHYGIVFYKNGEAYVSHNPFKRKQGFKPEIITLEDFKKERKIKRFLRNEETKLLTDDYILSKSNSIIEKYKYKKSFIFNCEDYIREISNTSIGIDQRVAWIIGIVLVGLLMFSYKKYNR